jgi:hypothetical protein
MQPEEGQPIASKLEFHYTPRLLNMVEIELSVFGRQRLARRIPSRDVLENEARAWQTARSACQVTVNWRFMTKKACQTALAIPVTTILTNH